MKTLDKYLIREMIVPFIAGMLMILVLWVGNIVFLQVSILRGRTELLPVFLQYVLLKSVAYVTVSLAAGSIFGSALAISRLTRDSEITVMRMAGVSVRRIMVPLLAIGFLVSIVAFLVQEKVVPLAEKRSETLILKMYAAETSPFIQSDVFFNWRNYYFYVQEIRRGRGEAELRDVTVWELPAGRGYPVITTATSATWHDEIIEMRDGVLHKIGPDGFTDYEARFRRLTLNLKRQMQEFFQSQKTPEQMGLAELGRQIDLMGRSGLPIANMRIDYHFKLSVPLTSVILILCTAPLTLRFGRHSSFAGALLGIIVAFLCWNVMLFAKVFGQAGWLPPVLAGWSEIIVFLIVGAILVWKAE
jgi:lipopolysaccharide export system permease protein